MSIVEIFDYSISALTLTCYLISVWISIKFGYMNWKDYCIMTYHVIHVSFLSKTWLSMVNIVATVSLFAGLAYFEVYLYIVVNTILFVITVITALIGKKAADAV